MSLSQMSRELLGEWQAERYTLSYDVANNGNFWTVTVTARPNAGGLTYIGAGIASKVVRYVAQIPK